MQGGWGAQPARPYRPRRPFARIVQRSRAIRQGSRSVLIDGRWTQWAYDRDFGFIVVDVPAGAHTIDAAFIDTPVRAWADRISLLSAALWVASVLGFAAVRLRRRSMRSAIPPDSSARNGRSC